MTCWAAWTGMLFLAINTKARVWMANETVQ